LQALGVWEEGPDEVAFAVFPSLAWITADDSLIQRWWTTSTAVAWWHCLFPVWKKLLAAARR
jgi:hypothetical protein